MHSSDADSELEADCDLKLTHFLDADSELDTDCDSTPEHFDADSELDTDCDLLTGCTYWDADSGSLRQTVILK